MRREWVVTLCAASFVVGGMTHLGLAKAAKPSFDRSMLPGSDTKAVGAKLLDRALVLAGDGSWERIAVGRVWYLSGKQAKAQAIFDEVTHNKKVADSDWWRIARVYAEAKQWDKADAAFQKALALEPNDLDGMIERASYLNLNGKRAKAEEIFAGVIDAMPDKMWH